jgi:two-component system, NarL family, nitrate/nitrite response regulator NarL
MTRIVIVGEIRLYRDGLADLLGRKSDMDVVGTAAERDAAYQTIVNLSPDIVLFDMAMAGSHQVIATIRELVPEARVVALGVADREEDVLECAEAGVAGYISREGTLESLIEAIQAAVRGELLCSPHIAGSMLRRLATLSTVRGEQVTGADTLTPRETEILRLIDDGCSNKQIAGLLHIELATVKNHVHNLLDKLHVHRRGQAAAQVRLRNRYLQARE